MSDFSPMGQLALLSCECSGFALNRSKITVPAGMFDDREVLMEIFWEKMKTVLDAAPKQERRAVRDF